MSTAAAPGVAIVAVPPATAATVVWRFAGELRVTVVVKAAYVIVPEGPMAPAEPEAIITTEIHNGGSPARSVRLTPDTAPRMARPEVLLTGHACAPEGQSLRWLGVRLGVFREHALLDKTIYVYGDGGGETPFDRVPLVYERAYGGLGFQENPLGTGTLELSNKPNLVHPEGADRVACFAPVARTWPARRKFVSSSARKALDAAVAEIPDGFDWSYFQASPVDQRLDALRGDEWLVLEGMSAKHPRLRSRLPSARAVAVVQGAPGMPEGAVLDLAADTLRVDADRMGCTVVWRGDFAVPNEEALGAICVIAGVESEGAPIEWPAAPTPTTQGAEEVIELDADALLPMSTVTLEGPAPVEQPIKPAVPFVASAVPVLIADEPTGPLPDRLRRAEPASDRKRAATMVLTNERFGQTLAVSEAAPVSLPFARRGPPVIEVVQRPRWSPQPAPPVTAELTPQPAERGGETTAQGIRLDNETPLALAVVPWGLDPGRDVMAIVAKATCDLVPGDRAALRDRAEPPSGDKFAEGACVHPNDLAPFKVRADIVVVGHAYAPGGMARAMEVALRFGHEGRGFERRIRVLGDRRWVREAASFEPGPPEPFMTMPLTYARAFGGVGFAANPIGVGLVDRWRHARELPPLPNLEDPDALFRVPSQRPAPACFAPMPAAWRAHAVERRAPWARFPEDLDWTAHQAAPPSLRLPFLRGDEPFALAGMHRTLPVIEGQLPGVAARAFAVTEDGARFVEVTMRLDTVVLDTDAMKVTLVWRGALGVADEANPGVRSVGIVVEKIGDEGMSLETAQARFG